jgi:hypothetical protein
MRIKIWSENLKETGNIGNYLQVYTALQLRTTVSETDTFQLLFAVPRQDGERVKFYIIENVIKLEPCIRH